MCGICGIVGGSLPSSKRDIVVRHMMDLLSHRGPDGEGFATGESYSFGHKRLAVIDLETGNQPIWTEDGRYCIIYNGELYNYLELRQSLTREGVRFRTFSDTEVLLQLLVNWGSDALALCDGMFAFALFDNKNHELTLGRDHVGIKPLYFSLLQGGGLTFASEIKALLLHPHVANCPDTQGLREYMVLQLCLGKRTLFEQVSKLEPGTILTFRSGETPKTKKWHSLPFTIDSHHTEEYFLDSLLLALQDSVKLQLRSDVAIGAYLSGGLDSSAITSLASNFAGKLHCFTGRFIESSAYDESGYACEVAREVGGEFHVVTPSADEFVEWMPRIIYAMDEPVAGPGVFPQFLVSHYAKKHVTVALGGQGGDELFGGYARYLVAYLEQALRGAIFEKHNEGVFVLTLASIIPNLPVLQQYAPMLQKMWASGLFEPLSSRYFALLDRSPDIIDMLEDEWQSTLDFESVKGNFVSMFEAPTIKSSINKMLAFDIAVTLPGLLQVEDRASMYSSLESRVPLLSPKVMQLASVIPPTIKFKNGNLKYIFRESVKNFLPASIVARKDKMGFPVPLSEWLRSGSVRDFVCDTLLSHSSRQRGIYKQKSLIDMINKETPHSRKIWGALCLELWFQTFIDKPQKVSI